MNQRAFIKQIPNGKFDISWIEEDIVLGAIMCDGVKKFSHPIIF
jgi:hypothetical protein